MKQPPKQLWPGIEAEGEPRAECLDRNRYPEGEDSFLVLEKLQCRTVYPDGRRSDPYSVDCVHRRGLDSVAVVLYSVQGGAFRIGVRRALRPILQFRHELPLPLKEPARGMVWEAVAGSLEPEDRGWSAVRARVVEEVWEEAGFRVEPQSVEALGAGFFPSHGQSSEKIHMTCVEVVEGDRVPGAGRGTGPSEEGWTRFLDAQAVLRMCWTGEIEDPKVEIGVRRLLERAGKESG